MSSQSRSDRAAGSAAGDRRRTRGLQGIRARAVLIILVVIPVGVFFNVWGCWVSGGVGWTDSLIGTAVGGLVILTVANAALKRWRPKWVLSRAEVIAVYMALAIGIGMTASVWDWGGSIATVVAWPIWNAGPENQWDRLVWPNLPPWLVVTDRDALAGFFLGDTNPYQPEILLAWLRPAFWWTAWAVALLWVSMCLNVIVRRRWSQEEQLPFPMTILPLQMTDPRREVFSSPLWWIGIALSAGVILFNMISRFVPAFPRIPTGYDLGPLMINNRPWDALRTPTLDWELWHIGLSYLMPVDLAFSMIVFNLIWRTEYVVCRILGWTIDPWSGFPYGDQQTVGSFTALMVAVIWLDRRYLVEVLRKAIGLRSHADDSQEAFSYRTAVFGALGGLAFLWGWLARGGMTREVIAIFLFLYFIMAMVMGRMRAQLGPPNHEMYGAMPEFALTQFPGTRAIGSRGLGLLAILRPYMGEQRPNPAPAQLEGLRMAERASINPTQLAWIMLAVVPLTMLCYFSASIHVGYDLGLGTSNISRETIFVARDTGEKLDSWLRTPTGPSWSGVEAIGIGFGGTILLMALKLQFPSWPVHPVAFPLAFGYPIDVMLPAIIISWGAKSLLLRYGGLRAHRRALPFFLGLLAGGASAGLLQAVLFRILGLSL